MSNTSITPAEPSVPETHTHTPDALLGDHSHSDTVTLPVLGSVTVPGGIYTVVFIGLGILTLLEVALADILKDIAPVKGAVLLAIGFFKAVLVALFYMHLRKDSRVFALALIVPLIIVVLCLFYLIFVPSGCGLGYKSLTGLPC
jgi:caa(3)-type oxidase subunit IV